jgi:multicomponent Na+:H+ antiporter subunit C
LQAPHADPLPQALILTAIVIGFGIFAFFIVLIKRTHKEAGTDEIDDLAEGDA